MSTVVTSNVFWGQKTKYLGNIPKDPELSQFVDSSFNIGGT